MSTQNQSPQENNRGLEVFLLLACLVVAWPALLVGILVRWQMKQRTTAQGWYWIGTGALGVLGTIVLLMFTHPHPLLLLVLNEAVSLVFHLSMPALKHFLLDVIPLWERSLLVFPWLALALEFFAPKSLQATLIAHERRRQAIQEYKSRQATRQVRKAPDQINGKGVLGAVIENLNA